MPGQMQTQKDYRLLPEAYPLQRAHKIGAFFSEKFLDREGNYGYKNFTFSFKRFYLSSRYLIQKDFLSKKAGDSRPFSIGFQPASASPC
jgi:hypothetical protein